MVIFYTHYNTIINSTFFQFNVKFFNLQGTNRIVTIFMYLSDVDAGGGTLFPHSKVHGKVPDDRPEILHPSDTIQKEIQEVNQKMAQCSDTLSLQVHPKKGRGT